MKHYLFILAVVALLAFTSCSSQETQQPTTTQPGAQPATSPDDIDTSELDQLEQDLTTIEQGY